jgi:uncharacterized protein
MTTRLVRETGIPTDLGVLRGGVWVPDLPGPLPGIVLVDGSGDGVYDDWGGWPERIADCGAVVLTHDKPGSGGSPGNWMEQDLDDRACETCAAIDVLRSQPEVAGPVGLFGVSQGAWVAFVAAAANPASVDFVVSMSGPGVSVQEQDRHRIEIALRSSELSDDDVDEALAWIDERTRRLLAGEEIDAVIRDQQRFIDRAWASIALQFFDHPASLRFLAGILAFDPVPALARTTCPVLALFGAADTLVPVAASVQAFTTHLPRLAGDPSGLAVFPGADHGLFTADPIEGIDRTSQLAPGFLAMVAGFIAQLRQGSD